MFFNVTSTKLPPSLVWASRLRALLLAIAVCFSTWGATAAAETAPVATGESWTNSSGSVAGTVSTAPAAATPVTQPTPVTSAAQPATAATQPGASEPPPKPTADEVADADPEALTLWRPQLEPYGKWIEDSRYGVIWVPNREVVGANFSPYVTSGHWSLDNDDNWIWVSDHPFGWVVFHYGRWFYAPEFGWAWVPGRTYAPSWVVWRVPSANYAYVGWAPMPPRFGWYGSGVVWYSSYGSVSYVFCPSDYVFYPSVGVYLVHDPILVSRLGLYTTFYYPPYYGYYGHYGYRHHHDHVGSSRHRAPGYGPPMNRARISPRAVPRTRVSADPRAVAASRRTAATPTSASRGIERSPATRGSPRSSAAPARERERGRAAAPSPKSQHRSSAGRDREPDQATRESPRNTESQRAAPRAKTPRSRESTVRSEPTVRVPQSTSPRRAPSPSPGRKRR